MSRAQLFHKGHRGSRDVQATTRTSPPTSSPSLGPGSLAIPVVFPDAGKTGQVPARRPAGLSTPMLAPPWARPPAQHPAPSPRAALLLAHPTCLQHCRGTRAGQSQAKKKFKKSPKSSKIKTSEGVTPGYCTRAAKIRPSQNHDYLLMPCFSAKPYPVFLGLTFSPSILGLFNYWSIFSRHLS